MNSPILPLLLAVASTMFCGCVAPVGSAAVAGSAAAGASSAAMKAENAHRFGSEEIATQTLSNPALSVAPGAVLGGAAVGSAAGASVQSARELNAPARYGQRGGEFTLVDANGHPLILGGNLVLTGVQPTGPLTGDHPRVSGADLPAHPWVGETPVGIYVDYVLDETFIDEERRPWRAEMARRFAPEVAGCKTRREAILKVAERCAAVCDVKYSTQRRRANQCVAESLETGMASCSGLSVLLAAAYRSVGIPARLAQVAAWSDRPGNHTWVEVWDTDGWHFVEYYPDKAGLDHGWLLEPCAQLDTDNPLSRVVARTPHRIGGAEYFLPWDESGRRLCGEDRTAAYRQRARELGIVVGRIKPDQLVIIGAATPETRVARPFRVLDSAGREVAAGMTPGALDDANNAPRIRTQAGETRTVEITEADGRVTRRTVTAGRGDTEVR